MRLVRGWPDKILLITPGWGTMMFGKSMCLIIPYICTLLLFMVNSVDLKCVQSLCGATVITKDLTTL